MDKFKASYSRILESAHADGCVPYSRMLLITPPPPCEACQKSRTRAHSERYVAAINELAKDKGAVVRACVWVHVCVYVHVCVSMYVCARTCGD